MINIIAGLIIALAFFGAIAYIVRAKRRGVKCIGCSAAGQCSAAKTGSAPETGCDACRGCGGSRNE